MDDMHDQHETPTSDAARGVGHYLTGTLAATDLSVRLLTWLRKRTDTLLPGDLEQAGTVLDPKRDACAAMLARDAGRNAGSRTAVLAWMSAQPHRDDDPQADLVASRAETRLRDLHPDAMTRYDQLRAGLSPVEAMREVVPLIVVEQEQASAREAFSPLLDPTTAARAGSRQVLEAWSAALPFAETLPDAAKAAAAAEARLRELHPEAMSHYDSLREGHTPTAALAEVAPLIDPTGDAARRRSASDSAIDLGIGPSTQAPEHRYASLVRDVLGDDLAGKVLRDDSWATLAAALDKAEGLGAKPAELLAVAAGERELDSAKHAAGVLTFRIEQRSASPKATEVRTSQARSATAADAVVSSYPTPLGSSVHRRPAREHDPAVLGAALELGREESATSPRATDGGLARAAASGRQQAFQAPSAHVGLPAATAHHGYPTVVRRTSVGSAAPTPQRSPGLEVAAVRRQPPASHRR
jgi:hypothetical protein